MEMMIAGMAEVVIERLTWLISEEYELEMQLKEMKQKMETLKSVLPRMEMDKNWLCESRDLCYEVDDLLDEMVTERLMHKRDLKDGHTTVFGKVCRFLSNNNNQFVVGWKFSSMVNRILRRINVMLEDHPQYNNLLQKVCQSEIENKNLLFKHEEEDDDFIVGRDADKESIIDLLLHNPNDNDNFMVSIVGMGGLGKTTLAKYIYNDDTVNHEFQSKIWVTVSRQFDATQVLSTLKMLRHQKFLLVLDDVWDEDVDLENWHLLRDFFIHTVPKGSRCLLTTRSRVTAQSFGDGPMYELQCLPDPHSWELFERVAFSPRKQQGPLDPRLVDIGQRVVSKCAGLPLAIKAVGTLLQGRGFSTWFSWKDADFAKTGQAEGILPSLKLSYDRLSSQLKHCFTYCALFPKGRHMPKRSLIYLWMAQGFVSPADGRTPEDTAEEYFTALLQRSFFHDITTDSLGGITSCKMHDLLHDLASSLSDGEIFVASPFSSTRSGQTRHLSVVGVNDDSLLHTGLPGLKNIRTCLDFSPPTKIQPPIINSSFLSSARRLRVLVVHNLNFCSLPDTVGQLLLLRYLDLSGNSQLQMLPNSVTQLYNLQTLKLSGCLSLTELPHDFRKLVNLRHLDIHGCNELLHMPPGFSALTCLDALTMFVVGQQSDASVPDQLEVLKSLSNLKGSLTIKLRIGSSFNATKMRGAEYLKNMLHLKDLSIQWSGSKTLPHETYSEHEALLEGLKLQGNLRILKLEGFSGVTLPSWFASSANLVNICLDDCPSLRHLPQLSQLPHLKVLLLHNLGNLEYMERDCYVASEARLRTAYSSTFFPSLENLTLSYLPKLKGWRSVAGNGQEVGPYHWLGDGSFDRSPLPSFPRLCQLKIMECRKLISVPPCQKVEELNLRKFNEALQLILSSNLKQQQHSLRRRVTLDNVGYIKHLPLEFHQYISYIAIHLSDLENLSLGEEVLPRSIRSLQTLQVTMCSRLKSLSGLGWNHLASLQRLQLSNLPVLNLNPQSGDGGEDVMPLQLPQNLQILELDFLPKLVDLPEGIQYLTALVTLKITSCHSLKALPEWIGLLSSLQSLCLEACTALNCLPDSMMQLTSLRNLEVRRCSGYLQQKCQKPTGEDWPKIMHIPHISIL